MQPGADIIEIEFLCCMAGAILKIHTLLQGIPYTCVCGTPEEDISSISYDSRTVLPGGLFVCLPGTNTNGHHYLFQAVERGAAACLTEDIPKDYPKHCCILQVQDTRKAMAVLSSNYYAAPDRELQLVGITGTKGKTTTTRFLRQMLTAAELQVGSIGTEGCWAGRQHLELQFAAKTTPESVELFSILSAMKEKGIQTVVMEVSSHALALDRVFACQYELGVFTNLSLDHLDLHGSMECYADCKGKLFSQCRKAVVNLDNIWAEKMMHCRNTLTYSMKDPKADLYCREAVLEGDTCRFVLVFQKQEYFLKVTLFRKIHMYNILAAMGVCLGLGMEMERVCRLLPAIQ